MPKKHKPLNFAAVYLRGFLIFACARYLLPCATDCRSGSTLLSQDYIPYIYPP